jgi:hypothetical protein
MVDTKERQGWDEGNLVVIIYIRLDMLLLPKSCFLIAGSECVLACAVPMKQVPDSSGVQLRVYESERSEL